MTNDNDTLAETTTSGSPRRPLLAPRQTLRSATKAKMLDSDSSDKHHLRGVGNLATTVSVSTCPSCGSENVSSSSPTAGVTTAKTRRSSSFQHLIQTPSPRHKQQQSCKGCVRGYPVPRSQSFTSIKCPDYDSDKRMDMLLKCDCSACRARHKKQSSVAAKKYHQNRVRHEPLKKKRPKQRHGAMSHSFSGQASNHHRVDHLHQCNSSWCTRNKYSSGAAAVRPVPSSGLKAPHGWPSSKVTRKEKDHHHSHHRHFPSSADYRFWDVEDWRAQMKREKAREKEKAILMLVSAIGIIVFICVCYFGTLLFLRVTKLP